MAVRSVNAVDDQKYRLIENLALYEDNVPNELYKMTKKTAVQSKDGTFSGKDQVSIIAFLQDFKAACVA